MVGTVPVPRPMPQNPKNRKARCQEFKEEFKDYATYTELFKQSDAQTECVPFVPWSALEKQIKIPGIGTSCPNSPNNKHWQTL